MLTLLNQTKLQERNSLVTYFWAVVAQNLAALPNLEWRSSILFSALPTGMEDTRFSAELQTRLKPMGTGNFHADSARKIYGWLAIKHGILPEIRTPGTT